MNPIKDLIDSAMKEGREAALAVVPIPMGIIDGAQTWIVEDGVCGFAWINVKPAYSAVAKALVAAGLARKDGYEGGVTVWVSDYNQSITRKEAYARAFAKVLQDAGIRAYASSRMD
jgi:Fe-S oxidoreductase